MEIMADTTTTNANITTNTTTDAATDDFVETKPAAPAQQPPRPQITYPNPLLQAVISIGLLLAMFLVALDMVCAI